MRHLSKYKLFESNSENNEAYYTIQDILIDFMDDNNINTLSNEIDAETYLSSDNIAYGYHLDTPGFDATNEKTDGKIVSFAVWNINQDTVYKLKSYIDEKRPIIKELTGYNVTDKVEVMDVDKFDVYIRTISDVKYKQITKENKLKEYKSRLSNLSLDKIPEGKSEEVFELLDKLFKIL